MTERRFNPEHMARLESPERRRMLPPDQLLGHLEISGSMNVLDLGAGTGYFTIPAAGQTTGTVYALDVEPRMLERIRERAAEEVLSNIETVEGVFEDIPLEDGLVERVIASMVLHEAESLGKALTEIHRVLKPGGRCLCLEWEKVESESGPPLHHRVHSEKLKEAFDEAGFRISLLEHPTEAHYIMVAEKL